MISTALVSDVLRVRVRLLVCVRHKAQGIFVVIVVVCVVDVISQITLHPFFLCGVISIEVRRGVNSFALCNDVRSDVAVVSWHAVTSGVVVAGNPETAEFEGATDRW